MPESSKQNNDYNMSTDYYIDEGRKYYQEEHYKEALRYFERARRQDDQNAQAYVGIGDCLYQWDANTAAIDYYHRAIARDNNNTAAYNGLSYAHLQCGKINDAIKYNNKALEIDPHNSSVYNCKGHIYRVLQKYEEALTYFDQAIALAKKNDNITEYYYNKCLTLELLQRTNDAFDICEIVTILEQNKYKYHDTLKRLYNYSSPPQTGESKKSRISFLLSEASRLSKKSYYEIALKIIQKANDIDSTQPSIYVEKGKILLLQKQYTDAKKESETALNYQPNNIQAIMSKGDALYKLGDYSTAIEAYNEAVQIDNTLPEAYVGLGHSYLAQHKKALQRFTNNQMTRIAELLTYLAPLKLASLAPLAVEIIETTTTNTSSTLEVDLAQRLHQILTTYSIPQEQADLFLLHHLLANNCLEQAEELMIKLIECKPHNANIAWSLIKLQQQLKRPSTQRINTLRYFVQEVDSNDPRHIEAVQWIDEILNEELQKRTHPQEIEHILKVYTSENITTPLLQSFRSGNWDNIPALQAHPDFSFPPIVAIDIEVDPQPGTPAGSRIFEVAAARYKGQTRLDFYTSYIHRNFQPAKWEKDITETRLRTAPSEQIIAQNLTKFIGDAFIVGHNICAFDQHELAGINVTLDPEKIIDTLTLARLLHPDSIRHNLSILCQAYNIEIEPTELHSALPDAQACAQLLYKLGKSLSEREEQFLNGFRALVQPDSALDRVILQPHHIPADPTLKWKLDPHPTLPRIIASMSGHRISQVMSEAVHRKGDEVIEHNDLDACYTRSLYASERTIIAVGTRTRIERILNNNKQRLQHFFVLPDIDTLLCPDLLQQAIETETSNARKLHLFCLYQGSHNHDAATLYPLRLPSEALVRDSELQCLKQTLTNACCATHVHHIHNCNATIAAAQAQLQHNILVCTHEALLKCQTPPRAAIIIIDDAFHLQMHLAEYSTQIITDRQIQSLADNHEQSPLPVLFKEELLHYIADYVPEPGYHERLPLGSFYSYLTDTHNDQQPSLLTQLEQFSIQGQEIASRLKDACHQASQPQIASTQLQAYWIDLHFDHTNQQAQLLSWNICMLDANPEENFLQRLWQPYVKHIVAGPALITGKHKTQFLERTLGILSGLQVHRDIQEFPHVYLPTPETLPPAGLMRRRRWIIQVSNLIASKIDDPAKNILVSLNNAVATDTLIQTYLAAGYAAKRQILATPLNWSATKINERMQDPTRRTLTFASPAQRQTLLDGPVDLEITGPLQFLNSRDPLVSAYTNFFAQNYPQEGAFNSYILPQALLEIKARLTSQSRKYIICDSGLLTKNYYNDEIRAELSRDAQIHEISLKSAVTSQSFSNTLSDKLAMHGMSDREEISERDLHLMLRNIWDAREFRKFKLLEEPHKEFSQQSIIRSVLAKKDQLVVIATGGGKSLCFQLPAIIMSEAYPPKVTLVFSPLIALMNDQIVQLNHKGIHQAIALNSTISMERRQEYLEGIKRGIYSIIYLAPEQIYSSKLRQVLQHREIGLITVDEAHCLSQWGHDFRTDYFTLKKWVKKVLCHDTNNRDFPIIALTATARKGYQHPANKDLSDKGSTVKDIVDKLGLRLREDEIMMSTTIRPELEFHFEYIEPFRQCQKCRKSYNCEKFTTCPHCGHKPHQQPTEQEKQKIIEKRKKQRLVAILKKPEIGQKADPLNVYERLARPIAQRQRVLIYCAYRATTEDIAHYLTNEIPEFKNRISYYHAGLSATERKQVQQCFTSESDEDRLDIVVATNAFGMGIDIRRLGVVIHFDTPGTPEAYYQEAGRAGRDAIFGNEDGKERAQCILLFHPTDMIKQRNLTSQNFFSDFEVEDVYEAISKLYQHQQEISAQRGQAVKENYQSFNGQIDPSMHVFASTDNIATLSGISADRITTLLHYLEYHTTDKKQQQPVLEREATAINIWQLKLEKDYQAKIKSINNPSAYKLLQTLTSPGEYQLDTETFKPISGKDLADALGYHRAAIEDTLLVLIRKQIILYGNRGHFRFNTPISSLDTSIQQLGNNLQSIFTEIDQRRKDFGKHKKVYINLRSIIMSKNIDTIPFHYLARFLFMLSQNNDDNIRILDEFSLNTRHSEPDHYDIKLYLNIELKQLFITIETIINKLRETITLLAKQLKDPKAYNDWHPLDLFSLQLDYSKRRIIHHRLLLLESLGILQYTSDPALGQAIHIVLLQRPIDKERLNIDLTSLRQQEQYTKSKRQLMEQYITAGEKERYAEQFARYFQGAEALINHTRKKLRADLNEQQRDILNLTQGVHVITGPAGCGKTTTLVEYIKNLVFNRQVPIEHIMIVTHYQAAGTRIVDKLQGLDYDGNAAVSNTINAFGNKIFLRYRHDLLKPDDKPYYGRADEPKLLISNENAEEEIPYINKALKKLSSIDFTQPMYQKIWPQQLDLPKFNTPYEQNYYQESHVHDIIHRLRQHGIFPGIPTTKDQLESIIGTIKEENQWQLPELYAAYIIYFQVQAEDNVYTFEDQILFPLAILHTNAEILQAYQRHYQYIIIDELQDFTPAKVELILNICNHRGNIMAFGDPVQEILFDNIKTADGKSARNIRSEAKTVFNGLQAKESCGTGKIHKLGYNYRSTQEILDFITYIRDKIEDNKYGSTQVYSALNHHGPKPLCIYTADSAAKTLLDEALTQCEQLSPAEQGNIVLICGNKSILKEAQRLLLERKIPFSLMDGLKGTYELPHIQDILLYLRLIEDPSRDSYVERLLRHNIAPYLTDEEIGRLKENALSIDLPLFDLVSEPVYLRDAKIRIDVQAKIHKHLQIVKQRKLNDPVQFIEDDLRALGNDSPWQLLANEPERLQDIDNLLTDFSQRTIKDALAEIAQHIQFLDSHQGHSALVLTTADHSKGQEAETVFILGVDRIYNKRLYVTASRAKSRLFMIGEKEKTERHRILQEAQNYNIYDIIDKTQVLDANNLPVTH